METNTAIVFFCLAFRIGAFYSFKSGMHSYQKKFTAVTMLLWAGRMVILVWIISPHYLLSILCTAVIIAMQWVGFNFAKLDHQRKMIGV